MPPSTAAGSGTTTTVSGVGVVVGGGGGGVGGGGGIVRSFAAEAAAAAPPDDDAGRSSERVVDYLISYEGMIRRQDAEFDATTGHVGRVASRIRSLGGGVGEGGGGGWSASSSSGGGGGDSPRRRRSNANDANAPPGEEGGEGGMMITYDHMRRCLLRLGVGVGRQVSAAAPADPSRDVHDDDDDGVVSALSCDDSTSSSRGGGGGGGGSSSGGGGAVVVGDILATDAQLIMLMTALVEAEEGYRRSRASSSPPAAATTTTTRPPIPPPAAAIAADVLDRGLSVAEFVQAYELVVCAMQSINSVGGGGEYDAVVGSKIASRLKERTAGMLRAFGPDSSSRGAAAGAGGGGGGAADDDGGVRSSSPRGGGGGKTTSSSPSSGGGSVPFASDDMMTRVIRSKDVALSRIMEEHEAEMEDIAGGIEELRSAESRVRDALARRRRRARSFAMLSFGIVACAGVIMEAWRGDRLARELARGREAERAETLLAMSSLTDRRAELRERLAVVEGKVRHQANRNTNDEARVREVEARIDEVDLQWLMDREEIGGCFASGVESGEDLKRERSRGDGIEEELAWCRGRLRSREEAASEGGSERRIAVDDDDDLGEGVGGDGGGVATIAGSNGAGTGGRRRGPVYLEMKYNRSVRDAMLLRQGYSALAGFGAAALLRGLVGPAFVRLFLPVVQPGVVAVVTPALLPAAPGPGVEMAVVDGIFGSSIAYLLIRAVATFLMP